MTKAAFIEAIQEQQALQGITAPTKDIDTVFTATINVMAARLADGEDVQIKGFGSFKVVDRAERNRRNPKTGAPVLVPAGRTVKFVPGTPLKDAVNVM